MISEKTGFGTYVIDCSMPIVTTMQFSYSPLTMMSSDVTVMHIVFLL